MLISAYISLSMSSFMKKIFIYGDREKLANYVTALEKAGAEVICSFDTAESKKCDALLLSGGADIDPKLYGQENTASVGIDHERDAAEYELIGIFREMDKPILGICRGHQILNVALGGTLLQHIPGHTKTDENVDRVHPVTVEHPFLRNLYGDGFVANSAHHQVVDRLGDGLSVTCRSEEGYVEGMIHENGRVFSVQFHPERIAFANRRPDADDGEALFRAFAAML